jgi:hypothetical protein
MSHRISPIAKPGSLLKAMREAKRGRRPKRELNTGHLALVRRLPCLACDADPAGEAAHLRINTRAGTGLKPGDRWALPLCHACHTRQHSVGELTFWRELALDPIRIAVALHAASGDIEAMRSIAFQYRSVRK